MKSGGAVRIRVFLIPAESFTIQRGRLEISVITTHFSRTVLDGYHEHTTEKLCRLVELCGEAKAHTGEQVVFSEDIQLSRKFSKTRDPQGCKGAVEGAGTL